jgi:N-acetylmuramoyl-L-alanine amidase
VHHNGDSDGPRNGPGTEVFFQHASADSKRLAGLIYEEVVKALSQYEGVAWQADSDAGVKPRLNDSGGDYYGILRRPAPVVSVLSEALFMSNPPEAELIARADVQKAEGDAIARGIVRYLTTSDPGSGYVEPYPRTQPAGGGGGSSGCVDPPFE